MDSYFAVNWDFEFGSYFLSFVPIVIIISYTSLLQDTIGTHAGEECLTVSNRGRQWRIMEKTPLVTSESEQEEDADMLYTHPNIPLGTGRGVDTIIEQQMTSTPATTKYAKPWPLVWPPSL